MHLCPQLHVYGGAAFTLLGMAFTMLALSRFGKKHRDDTAYTVFVGVSLVTLANILVPGVFNTVINLVHNSNNYLNAISGGAISAVTATVLLMVVGKPLKVKTIAPKTLLICFFVGLALSNLVSGVLLSHCPTSAAVSNHR